MECRACSSRDPIFLPLVLLLFGPLELLGQVSTCTRCIGMCYSSRLTLKSTFEISSNPSSIFGSRYRLANPVNAILGSIVLFSGFICKIMGQYSASAVERLSYISTMLLRFDVPSCHSVLSQYRYARTVLHSQ